MNALTTVLVNILVFAVLALGGGLASAWYMIEGGSRLSTRSFGPWLVWTAAGRPEADPYTRAHVARNGLLPLSSTLQVVFKARTDNSGSLLTSTCDYNLLVDDLTPAWWSLAVFDAQGRLIANAAERYAFNSDNVMREPDGRASITVARDARPGNWLPSGRGNRIVLVFTIQDQSTASSVHDGGSPKVLPQIQRASCR